MKKLFILACGIIMLTSLISACGSSDSNTGTLVPTASAPTATPTPIKHFAVGQIVKVGDTWQLVINTVKTSKGDEFTKPQSGNVFVIIDVSIKNISTQEGNISSLLNFTLKDVTGQKYNESIESVGGGTAPNGKVESGDNLRGQLVYEVPTSQHKFTIAFESSILSSGQTIWDISI